MLVKKTKFAEIDVVELPEPSATCVRGMSCQLERHFWTMGMSYGMLRSRFGVDKARKL